MSRCAWPPPLCRAVAQADCWPESVPERLLLETVTWSEIEIECPGVLDPPVQSSGPSKLLARQSCIQAIFEPRIVCMRCMHSSHKPHGMRWGTNKSEMWRPDLGRCGVMFLKTILLYLPCAIFCVQHCLRCYRAPWHWMLYQMQPVRIAPLQLQIVIAAPGPSVRAAYILTYSFAQFANLTLEIVRTWAFMCTLASQEMSH